MDPTSAKDINLPTINQCPGAKCPDCLLYINQPPLRDEFKDSTVIWVGLSAVDIKDLEDKRPLSSSTKTGILIDKVESPLLCEESFYRTNLVKCLPLDDGTIRYPNTKEMKACYSTLEIEIDLLKPKIVFLLGRHVITFVTKKLSLKFGKLNEFFKYEEIIVGNIRYIPIHHPSYINIYKSKRKQEYIDALQLIIKKEKNQKLITVEEHIFEPNAG